MILDRLRIFATQPLLAWPLIAGNLAAVWWGWTDYYAYQFQHTTPWLWPWVADSPNAVLLFALALVLRQFRRRAAWLDLLAWATNIQVGVWTVFVLLYYYADFFSHDATLRWTLLWLHVGMIGQAFVLHRDLRAAPPRRAAFGLVAGWIAIHFVLDYGMGIHPILPGPSFPVVAAVTFGITLLTLAMGAWLYRAQGNRTIEASLSTG